MLRLIVFLGLFLVLMLECQSASIGSRRVARAIPAAPLLVGYWGQNGAGPTFGQANYEKPLKWFCENSQYDIINVAFLVTLFDSRNKDSLPGLNFAFHCGGGVSPQHPFLFRCPAIEEGIKACQQRNKKVLMSVGGSTMFADLGSVANAKKHAGHLWNLFLGGSGMANLRPFGTAVMDGIDFNLEAGKPDFFADAIKELRRLMATDSSKSYLIASAPQCPYPDRMLGPDTPGTALADAGRLTDYVFIQYYNNFCWTGAGNDFNTNLERWLAFSRKTNVGVMIGLPAHTKASGQARYHRTVNDVDQLWQGIKDKQGVSGIMLWDVSWDQNNVISGRMYSEHMNDILDGSPTPAPTTPALPKTTTTQAPQPPTTTQAPPPPTTTQAPPPPTTTQPPPPPTTTTQPPPVTTGPAVPDNFCDGKQGIHHPYPGDCTKFIKCSNSKPYIFNCPAGLYYDKTIMVCNWPNLVQC